MAKKMEDGKEKRHRILKRSKTGIEVEFHLINKRGRISSRASDIIARIKKLHPGIEVTSEIGRSMIEFGSYPDVETYNPALNLADSLEKAGRVCEDSGLMIYPFATYPGRFRPLMNRADSYSVKKKVFGTDRIAIACSVTGFHHHYTLPKGVFDTKSRMLRLLKKSKLEHSMVSSYNFEIAIDPALTLLTQSSPFYQGLYYCKDSRMILYRGGKKLRYKKGLYGKAQQVGGLPPYKQTATDLFDSLARRWRRWERLVKKADPGADFDRLYPNKLDITWNPVKLNKHGTLEQRGMSANYLSVIVAVTILLKFCLKKIQREFIEVVPADFAVNEPFKIENGVLYIPPHSYVRNRLQPWSAYFGYEHEDMHSYTKKFFSFARSLTPKRYYRMIRPLYDMIENKSSVSDQVISYAKKSGYLNNGSLSQDDAAELALHYARQFPVDLKKTRKALERLSSL